MPNISRRSFLALAATAFVGSSVPSPSDDMPTMLDHILLGCGDLDRGIDFVEKHTGVRAAFGGVHPGRGTRNALLSLGEKHYLEIIAPDPAQPHTNDPLPQYLKKLADPRLVGWAAHPGDLDQFATHLRAAGIAFEGPTPGSRRRPDGRLLQWKTLNLNDDHGHLLPFFIEWGADSVHPSADAPVGCRIMRFVIWSPDAANLGRLCNQLGLDVPVEKSDTPQLQVQIVGPHGKIMEITS
jgi:catechol 2,3-dioxygenase-like lactoylglutathione lyase family enzyme